MIVWFKRILVLLSHALNVLFLFGQPDESVSGRAYRQGVLRKRKGWALLVKCINTMFFWEYDHCMNAHLNDVVFAKKLLELSGFAVGK